MPLPDEPKGNRVVLRFGAGLNTVASERDIDLKECASGENFGLQLDDQFFFRREAFDLAATTPNALGVRGFGQLEDSSGDLFTFVQAGGVVYSWDGLTTFTEIGAVNPGAKLRGHKWHNWPLDTKLIITDIEGLQPVMEWDGTSTGFRQMTTNVQGGFYAKYCTVENERVWYANVKTTTETPHLLVVSARGDYDNLTVNDRPSGTLAITDPFFLTSLDYRAINGIHSAFNTIAFSTERGKIYKITGSDARDFAIAELYPGSGAVGDEAFEYIGNDIAIGAVGKIETLLTMEAFGDVATDDLTRPIVPSVRNIDEWLLAYNTRLNRLYCFSRNPSFPGLFVLYKAFLDERGRAVIQRRESPNLSPWSKWTTSHALDYRPECAMRLRRPTDGLEHIYMGGSSGQIFVMEGVGGSDGGSATITANRISKTFEAPDFGETVNVTGYIVYRRFVATTVTLRILWGGENVFNESITITLAEADSIPVFGGNFYFGGDVYFSSPFERRLTRNPFTVPGSGGYFQVELEIADDVDFFIHEVALEFEST